MDYRKHVEYFFMAIIVGSAGLGISTVQKMSEDISKMTVSVQMMSDRILSIDSKTQDHEVRIRDLERRGRKY